jgi:hypothetical protein
MSIILAEKALASIPSPAVGKALLFVDSADEKLKKKLSDGSIESIESLTNDASELPFTPSGNISATNVQDAIEELDSEKLSTSHAGSGGSAHANATTLTSGFMSASDKQKLEDIASNIQSNLKTSFSIPSNYTALMGKIEIQINNTITIEPNGRLVLI